MNKDLARTLRAACLCLLTLVIGYIVMFQPAVVSGGREDPISGLLRLPAPPPPNPLVHMYGAGRDESFYSTKKIPSDDAPIDDLIDYWSRQIIAFDKQAYTPEMPERTLQRLLNAIEDDPSKLTGIMGALPEGEKTAAFVKRIYDNEGTSGAFSKDERREIKDWLVLHSSYFSDELARKAEDVQDTQDYVANHEMLLQLTKWDFDKARPIIDRLAANARDKGSRVVADWAMYRHALEEKNEADADDYRERLKKVVEDKTMKGPIRDLAMDALTTEKEWPGRDDWYASLLGDETLADLGGYTGLTTLINTQPEGKYTEKMLELIKSDNPTVRGAAIRNLTLKLSKDDTDVIRALLPWLEDPNWAADVGQARMRLVQILASVDMPEAVSGLIKMLDERVKGPYYGYTITNTNSMSNANLAAQQALMRQETFAFRTAAADALGNQKDVRAVPALRRVLDEAEGYERTMIVKDLIQCKGFATAEQATAIEWNVKHSDQVNQVSANTANAVGIATNQVTRIGNTDMVEAVPMSNSNSGYITTYGSELTYKNGPLTAQEMKILLGSQLIENSTLISDDVADAVVDRIQVLDDKDPGLAKKMRSTVVAWKNGAINRLMLRDLKVDKADTEAVLRLLAYRKQLRDDFGSQVADARQGSATAVGITSCILDDHADFDTILQSDNTVTKRALLACARLLRAPLPLDKVIAMSRGGDNQLAPAAEEYLETEDSPQARAAVLALHPNEAKILGATTAFFPQGSEHGDSQMLGELFASVNENMSYTYGWMGDEADPLRTKEKTIQDEVKKDDALLGIYSYDGNYVRIYKDKAVFSWDEDESRSRERKMGSREFEELKSYLANNHVEDLPPFTQCGGEYCEAKELVMLGRAGGRRVYTNGGDTPAFFRGLDKFFEDARKQPATIKYALSRELPGLELLLANEALHAETVWKNGDDLRVAASETAVRKKVEEEIDDAVDQAVEKNPDNGYDVRDKLKAKKEYEGYAWHKILNGEDAGFTGQPPGVEFIPIRDGLSVQSDDEQWKARAGGIEIRTSENGLFRLTGGGLSIIKKGNFYAPLITPNGRWVIAIKYGDREDEQTSVVRYNLQTGRMFPVKLEGYQEFEPAAYLASVNKVVIKPSDRYAGAAEEAKEPYYSEPDDQVPTDHASSEMYLLDPDTGAVEQAEGELRPPAQETFRPLQKGPGANEYWAAIPDSEKNSTEVGIYDEKNMSFKSVLKVPKIQFNSMSMWVDDAGKKVYFVYRGHLLALPLPK
ncbi:MAG: hypothetical protein JO053_00350 [Acidobacteria bacterium]|nr:hypothetical protein [Acidobacteriota bacterium]